MSGSKSKTKSRSPRTNLKKKSPKKNPTPSRGNNPPNEFESGAALELAVGHRPVLSLKPQDEALFKAFQSNLLSLISHELRTPLTGILNALSMLGQPEAGIELDPKELVSMARRNAQRLHRTLAALLDLAEIESGIFHARLSEVDLGRLAKSCLHGAAPLLRDRELRIETEIVDGPDQETSHETLALVDPQKFGRALDLCCQSLLQRAQGGSTSQVRISSACVEFLFTLEPGKENLWQTAWTEALAGFRGGVLSPGSAFAATMQSEEIFLTRMEEGLGSEFLLIHEIMRLHHGRFAGGFEGEPSERRVRLALELPDLPPLERLRIVVSSRTSRFAFDRGALGTVALALVRVPDGIETDTFRDLVRRHLFRASDTVYALPAKRLVALVLDDCKPADAPGLLGRIGLKAGVQLVFGASYIPTDGVDAVQLIESAERRLSETPTIS